MLSNYSDLDSTNDPVITAAETPAQETVYPRSLIVREIIETLLLSLLIFWLVNSVVGRVRIEGTSMVPTVLDGQYIFTNKLAYFMDEPDRGDVVVLHSPRFDRDLIKRVIGLPGDEIRIEDSILYINDVMVEEEYINGPTDYSGSWSVPEGEVFVLGDNRNVSYDSHSYGSVPIDNIFGRSWVIYWPVGDIHRIEHAAHALDS